MTRDEIIKLARESGLFVPQEGIPENGAFMRFAALVVEKEREECAKVCEAESVDAEVAHDDYGKAYNAALTYAAKAIRARGE